MEQNTLTKQEKLTITSGWEVMVVGEEGQRLATVDEVTLIGQMADEGRSTGATWQEIEEALEKIGISLKEVKPEDRSVI